ncbi:AMP-dependent synthetase/ligase [Pseudobacteriovorax antillogorgiicola]|uniref:Long-chain acyl-CoA synthetase n=1 Tax=Pseudobacteriovorax antillogorgiicola TaxID=1513793 RepID=A0A1Y6CRL1_9BACT|nr:long-chain fatty acid--CoA ligase [Pseudobacteriovorax antillogorgiicola]TCS46350.1 long-chain acyl-CoA synthetase [Pseudobacteriovorax antillogorgiicola]SMF68121.1 long-chain acyl-CoA synthetase [Pseudobacteriovorax antillogorgiicola]
MIRDAILNVEPSEVMQFKNLIDQFQHACREFGNRPLFGTKVSGSYQWRTFDDFRMDVEKLHAHFSSLGLKKGDRIAIISRNCPEWAATVYGALHQGVVYVPMYENQHPDEWDYIIKDAKPKVVVAYNEEILAKLPRQDYDFVKEYIYIDPAKASDEVASYREILRTTKAKAETVDIAPRDLAGLIYTSGTTGHPKGVMLCHENIIVQCDSIQATLDIRPTDRSLVILPWAHIYGQTCELHSHFRFGFASAFVEDFTTIQANIQEVKPTLLVGVPRIFHKVHDGIAGKIAAKPKIIQKLFAKAIEIGHRRLNESISVIDRLIYSLASVLIFKKIKGNLGGELRYCISGAAALRKPTNEFFHALGLPIYEGYGLTETAPLISVNNQKYNRIGSVGRTFPHIELTLEHVEGCEKNEGEIVVSGPGVMLGYYKLDEETNKVLVDGKFHTGDIGRLEDGYLHITGRIKEQYKMENGKYVVPGPVEEEISMHALIDNSVLYGEGRSHNVLLAQINQEELVKWLGEKELNMTAEEAIHNASTKQELTKDILGMIKKAKKYERPSDCLFTLDEWTTDNGLLTPSMKVKRKKVLALFKEQIEEHFQS